jgi:hypothetical protein
MVDIVNPLLQGSGNTPLELAKGRIPGHELVSVFGRVPSATLIDVSDFWSGAEVSPVRVESVANETWEVVSDSADDASTGTGARSVLILYLDEDYVEHTHTVPLNGTTPAPAASNMYRHLRTEVITKGPGSGNVGNISVQVQGGGDLKGYIPKPSVNTIGQPNRTMETYWTVKAGHTGFIAGFIGAIDKNKDIIIDLKSTTKDNGIYVSRLDFAMYQAPFQSQLAFPTEPFLEKSDIKCQCISTNSGISGAFGYQIIIVDNGFL